MGKPWVVRAAVEGTPESRVKLRPGKAIGEKLEGLVLLVVVFDEV